MKASLFVSCLVDQFYPEIGQSAVNVLRRLGVDVDFPYEQTCCGQPAFNAGLKANAVDMARNFIRLFRDAEYVVVPSGSCGSMIKNGIPELLNNDSSLRDEAISLANRTYELSQFLVNILKITNVGAKFKGKVTYHASCHLLRDLGVHQETISLIKGVRGIELVEMAYYDECCGFGGTFAVKYPEISAAIVGKKLLNIQNTGADAVISCDAGCLMNIAGAISRNNINIKSMHLAQLLDQGHDNEN